MDYNSSRNTLIFKEYGRNIQKLVDFAVEIKSDEKRLDVANYIIGLMGQMNPHLKNVEQFRHKLWEHLFKISKYKLEVPSPYPLSENEELIPVPPKRLEYPQGKVKFRHYGRNVELLVNRCVEMADEPEKQLEFARVIGNYMKMVYRNWNHESVDDDIIIRDLKFLSDGKLVLTEEANLDRLSRSNKNKSKPNSSSGGSRTKSYSNNRNNNRNKNNRQQNNRYNKKRR